MTESRSKYSPTRAWLEIQRSITHPVLYKVYGEIMTHRGKDNAITREQLSEAVFGEFTKTNDRRIRNAIKRLFTEYALPVGATSGQAGYYIITTEAEREAVKEDAVRRRDAENEFIRLIDNLDLETEPAPPTGEGVQIGLF